MRNGAPAGLFESNFREANSGGWGQLVGVAFGGAQPNLVSAEAAAAGFGESPCLTLPQHFCVFVGPRRCIMLCLRNHLIMRVTLLCLLWLCSLPLARAGSDLPKLGKASEAWFGDNPYAADSSVYAYVIAQDIEINFGFLRIGSTGLTRRIDTRRIVRVLDPQGYGQALVEIQYYDPEGGGVSERLTNVDAYTHRLVGGKIGTQRVAREEQYRTRLSPEYVEVAFSFSGVVAVTVLDLAHSRESGNLSSCPVTYFQDLIPGASRASSTSPPPTATPSTVTKSPTTTTPSSSAPRSPSGTSPTSRTATMRCGPCSSAA